MNLSDIKQLINAKKAGHFTGCLKFTYQGKNTVASCIESNSTEAIITKSEDYSYVLSLAAENGYSGTIILEFLDGAVTGYAYTRKLG
mgnify:CR=1 FL=1